MKYIYTFLFLYFSLVGNSYSQVKLNYPNQGVIDVTFTCGPSNDASPTISIEVNSEKE